MAPPRAEVRSGALAARLSSALIMAPVVLAATYFGGSVFLVVVAALGVTLVWEWSRLSGGADYRTTTWAVASGLLLVVFGYALLGPARIPVLVAAGIAIAGAVSLVGLSGRRQRSERATGSYPLWTVGGYLYISAACLALIWLREDPAWGRSTVFWVFAVVWAADTGAYAFGRAIGGPKLAPKISPNKTWAGFIGGTLCAGAAGGIVGLLAGTAAPGLLAATGLLVGVVSHLGDLFESWMKRHFNFKDSSALIPGHGGLFDRVDGLMAAGIAVGAAGILSGRTLLAWF